MEKKLSKRAKRKKMMEEMRKKQIEKAFEFPFCRRCKEHLDEKWVKKLKKEGNFPLCPDCYGPMMEQYKKMISLWAEFNRR